jgi:4-amino-4-deoxy-L-arabinose transferase-like glycosyltransferase
MMNRLSNKIVIILIVALSLIIRLWRLDSFPPGLYWDETSLGYDAYSLLKTGHDHRGNGWPTIWIESYQDYKPPLYVYTAIPFVAIFGLNPYSVRLPSVLAGTLTVLAVYLLIKELFKNDRWAQWSALLLAINPAHIIFSRGGFEVNLSVFLILLAVFGYVKALSRGWWFILSAVLFGLTPYAYHGAKLSTPLLVLGLSIFNYKRLLTKKHLFWFFGFGGLLLAFFWPHFMSLSNPVSKQRFQETSAFTILDPIIESNQEIQEDGGGFIARLWHHRYFKYLSIFKDKYVSHFDFGFLFLNGDSNVRHSVQLFGGLYHIEIVLIAVGIFTLIKQKNKKKYFVILPLLLAPITASLTKATPHTLRTLLAMPFWAVLSGLGISVLVKKQTGMWEKILIGLLFTEVVVFGFVYTNIYPKLYSRDWQYAYLPLFGYLQKIDSKYEHIYIDNEYGRSYMYYLFYSQVDPSLVQAEVVEQSSGPLVEKIGKYEFGHSLNTVKTGSLSALASPLLGKTPISIINFLDNKPAFYIYEN